MLYAPYYNEKVVYFLGIYLNSVFPVFTHFK